MALSPMMKQYLEVKEQYPDALLFFRLGDFYEMFFEDAVTGSRELELTLTGRDCGLEKRAPMCGVPYHAVETYLSRLVSKGYKVAICEQMEDPAEAKGIVKRAITRVVTPGTLLDDAALSDSNNFMLSAFMKNGIYGIAYLDAGTGDFFVRETINKEQLYTTLCSVQPSEVILSEDDDAIRNDVLSARPNTYISRLKPWYFDEEAARRLLTGHFSRSDLTLFDAEDLTTGICAAGALLSYALDTQKSESGHITTLTRIRDGEHMTIDSFTYRNLELTSTLRGGKKKGSLLWILDNTKTAMGARLLRRFIDAPLQNKSDINDRLSAVAELKDSFRFRQSLSEALSGVYDIERLVSRIAYGTMDARTALSLRQSLEKLPLIKDELKDASSPLLSGMYNDFDTMPELYDFLSAAISDKPPVGIKDGGMIKPGFNDEVDRLRDIRDNGDKWVIEYEQREREATGIKNLKVGYNRVFGYYIDVTRSYLSLVPYSYTRKQTLAGSERYITKELKDMEESILGAAEKLNKLEYELMLSIREKLSTYTDRLQSVSKSIALCDVLCSFAQAAYDNGYVKPRITENGVIDIKGGRHPVVEKTVKQDFVPNDVYLDADESRLILITGPNMAGKSTYMRQTGLIVLMAHIGSFVPASSASISIVDRVFTRVGASDDLASGQSTFMVEMNELAGILNNATDRSLIILDEIGRGTSTLDGLSIAWATIEYILNNIKKGAKTLFATHFHELTDLEGSMPGVKNFCITVKEFEDQIIFLHKIKRGGSDRSFGIEVARLAGLPEAMLTRAKELMQSLEASATIQIGKLSVPDEVKYEMPPEIKRLISSIASIDINSLTPLEALSLLNDIQEKVK